MMILSERGCLIFHKDSFLPKDFTNICFIVHVRYIIFTIVRNGREKVRINAKI